MKGSIKQDLTSFASISFLIPFLLLSFVTRIVLTSYAITVNHVSLNFSELSQVFSYGVLNDLVCFIYCIAPITILSFFIPNKFRNTLIYKILVYVFHFIWIFSLCFNLVAEFTFWEEFGSRFNFIAVDYLVYTHEVISNIIESYPVFIICTLIAFFSLLIFVFYQKIIALSFHKHLKRRTYFFQAIAINLLLALVWNNYQQVSTEKFSNRFLAELSRNGLYNLFSAYRNNSLDYDTFYKSLPIEESFKILKSNLNIKQSKDLYDIGRKISNKNAKNYNVIVLSIESLSSEFLDTKVNNQSITPNINSLIEKSLYFSNYYATGTRTVRGLEAMTLSVPPTPGSSIIRRPNNENLYSISSELNKVGYNSKFLYGGYSYFDDMQYFFSNNGFEVIDRADIPKEKITFANAWGIADGDLFERTLVEADKSYKSKQPFFHFVMTTSNHRPFTFPEDKIDLPQKTREAAVKYTDYAVGEFIKKAKDKPWFDNTIFVITADHCASSAGKNDVTYERYHIPLLIYAPKIIKPGIMKNLTSQIDLAPTILDILNVNYTNKFFGNSALTKTKDVAFMGTYQLLSYVEGNKMVILDPKHTSKFYKINPDKSLEIIEEDKNLLNSAISYYQSAFYLFSKGLMKKK